MGGLKRRKAAPFRHGKRRKTSGRRRKTPVPMSIVPKTLLRTFKYMATKEIIPVTGGVLNELVFKANGMFDPQVALGGHQPYGFDQWMTWYDHFTVVKSKMKIVIVYKDPNSNSTPFGGYATLRLDDGGTLETVVSKVLELPGTKYKFFGHDERAVLTKTFNARRFFGGGSKVGSEGYKGNTFNDPAEVAYFNLGFAPPLTGTPAVSVHIEILYTAMLTERRTVAQS